MPEAVGLQVPEGFVYPCRHVELWGARILLHQVVVSLLYPVVELEVVVGDDVAVNGVDDGEKKYGLRHDYLSLYLSLPDMCYQISVVPEALLVVEKLQGFVHGCIYYSSNSSSGIESSSS